MICEMRFSQSLTKRQAFIYNSKRKNCQVHLCNEMAVVMIRAGSECFLNLRVTAISALCFFDQHARVCWNRRFFLQCISTRVNKYMEGSPGNTFNVRFPQSPTISHLFNIITSSFLPVFSPHSSPVQGSLHEHENISFFSSNKQEPPLRHPVERQP